MFSRPRRSLLRRPITTSLTITCQRSSPLALQGAASVSRGVETGYVCSSGSTGGQKELPPWKRHLRMNNLIETAKAWRKATILQYTSSSFPSGWVPRGDAADGRGEKVNCGSMPGETAFQWRRSSLWCDEAGRTVGCGSRGLNYGGAPPIG